MKKGVMDNMLFHGSEHADLPYIKANAKSHTTGKEVAYFTSDRVYALVCSRHKQNRFVTMGYRNDDGKQHYFERFPNQLELLYRGLTGYLYILDSSEGLENLRDHSWESSENVYYDRCECVDDLFQAILEEEKLGNVVIHRYSEIDPAEQKMHANYIKERMDEYSAEQKEFYYKYFSSLWD